MSCAEQDNEGKMENNEDDEEDEKDKENEKNKEDEEDKGDEEDEDSAHYLFWAQKEAFHEFIQQKQIKNAWYKIIKSKSAELPSSELEFELEQFACSERVQTDFSIELSFKLYV